MEDKKLRALFVENLNYYLSLNGFSQADMARRMQVSTATAAKWCTGQTMPRCSDKTYFLFSAQG